MALLYFQADNSPHVYCKISAPLGFILLCYYKSLFDYVLPPDPFPATLTKIVVHWHVRYSYRLLKVIEFLNNIGHYRIHNL